MRFPLRFTAADIETFSAASHDRNPLHLSESYARRTPYAEPVVFGVLGALAALGFVQDRADLRLVRIEASFEGPLFVRPTYDVDVVDTGPERSTATIYDGPQVLLVVDATFAPDTAAQPDRAASDRAAGAAPRAAPADWDNAALAAGLVAEGRYCPNPDDADALRDRYGLGPKGIGSLEMAVLLCASYLVGMEIPGRRALFSRLTLDFPKRPQPDAWPVTYRARVTSFDARLNLLRAEINLCSDDGCIAEGEVRSFVREDTPRVGPAAVEALLPRSTRLAGKVALVVGASRGLGATIAQCLALQGCSVLANYWKSSDEAEQLKASLAGAPGSVALLQGDGGDARWCLEARQRITREFGRLDFLVCSAAPAPRPLWLDVNAAERVNEYVTTSLALVSAPLAAFVGLLDEHAGWGVVISSVVTVTAAPVEWPHYVSAKAAVEGLTRMAAAQHRQTRFMIVRPPRLLTDMTNTPAPLSRRGLTPTERIATTIVARLMDNGAAAAGLPTVLEDFS